MRPDSLLQRIIMPNDSTARVTGVIEDFTKAYYYTPILDGKEPWLNVTWRGIPALKCPLDLWIFQELMWRQKPDYVLECGVLQGGTTAFLGDIGRMTGARVIGIDQLLVSEARDNLSGYDNVELIEGSSIDPQVVEKVHDIVRGKNVMVILDSDHTMPHVLAELRAYSPLVPPGGWLIVEDTCVNGHPVLPDHGPGPMEAVEAFLQSNGDFAIDTTCHKLLATFNPNGYLRRKSIDITSQGSKVVNASSAAEATIKAKSEGKPYTTQLETVTRQLAECRAELEALKRQGPA